MAFPTNPNDGDKHNGYTYNSTLGVWENMDNTNPTFDSLTVNGQINTNSIITYKNRSQIKYLSRSGVNNIDVNDVGGVQGGTFFVVAAGWEAEIYFGMVYYNDDGSGDGPLSMYGINEITRRGDLTPTISKVDSFTIGIEWNGTHTNNHGWKSYIF